MAVSPAKTWVAGEVLTASDLNAEILNILNNGQTLGFPRTASADFDGNILILDADADTTMTSDTDDRIDIALAGTDLFRFDGTVTTPVNGLDFVAGATGSAAQISGFGTDTDVSINLVPQGSGKVLINGSPIDDKARRTASSNVVARTLRHRVTHIESNHIAEIQSLSF